jgi:signal transduction histidine kinase/uncharacterized membrane protein YgdD (TMEM256/DUF423 family)
VLRRPDPLPGGEPAGAAMVLRDVSDEHQYAEMLRHTNRELRRQAEILEQVNQQLREATKAKDQFLAVMSHELRTPINAIMGYSDLLDLGIKGELNDDQRAMLSRVRDTSRHLLGLINEVLDLAKIGAGRMDLVLVELDAAAWSTAPRSRSCPSPPQRAAPVDVDQPPQQQRRAASLADETRLTQIIINLLSNAVKFTPKAGSASASVTGEYVEIQVRTRARHPPDQQERVFEEFYQVEGGLARSSGGTGLGLAISRRFARLMGGDITVHSNRAKVDVRGHAAGGARRRVRSRGAARRLYGAAARSRRDRVRAGERRTSRLTARHRRLRHRAARAAARSARYGWWPSTPSLRTSARGARCAGCSTMPGPRGCRSCSSRAPDEAGETAVDIGRSACSRSRSTIELLRPASFRWRADVRRCVLIFDEDADVRRILGERADRPRRDVHTVANGGEAIDIERGGIDVAVLELMGDGDRGRGLAQIRADPTMHDVPVVMMIGRDLPESEMERLHVMIERTLPVTPSRARPTAALLHEAIVEPMRLRVPLPVRADRDRRACFAIAGALLAMLAVAAGAFGAHALAARVPADRLAIFEIAARYQMYHALGAVRCSPGPSAVGRIRLVRYRAWLILAGTVVFAGTLYAMTFGAPRWLGAVTPIGGALMILGVLGGRGSPARGSLCRRRASTAAPVQALPARRRVSGLTQ